MCRLDWTTANLLLVVFFPGSSESRSELFPGLIGPAMLEHLPYVRIDPAPISRNMDERTIRFELERQACQSLKQGGIPVVCHASKVQTVQHDFAFSLLDQCLDYIGSGEKHAVYVSIQVMFSDFIQCKNRLFKVCRPSSVSSSCNFWAQVLSGSNTLQVAGLQLGPVQPGHSTLCLEHMNSATCEL